MSLNGSCLCGNVQYETKGEPVLMGNCHCRDCQKLSGSAYIPVVAFLEENVKITGEVKYYAKKGDSGLTAYEGFCPNCGSRICAHAEAMPGLKLVMAGTLEEPENYKPQMDLYVGRANHWDKLADDTAKFEGMPSE
ncbi:MAG: aldehyde-activating protein [Gammaproteobacteria bacterium]|nr:MAG: aldehyde-activating protein [Gammaproteobacteria bacterium]RLA22947.1 MAG: aldehyde-activating protein [Gammaproteobacteria bacterium]